LEFKVFGISDAPCSVDKKTLKGICKLDKNCFGRTSWGATVIKNVLDQALTIAAYNEGEVVGAVSGRLFLSLHSVTFYINSLAVEPAFQRKGLGSKLIQRLQEILVNAGVKRIVLFSLPESSKFYEKMGVVAVDNRYVWECDA